MDSQDFKSKKHSNLGLEEIVHVMNKVGLEWAAAKKEAERLELMKSVVRAKIGIKWEPDAKTEAKLKRLIDSDPEYVAFIKDLVEAIGEAEKLRVRYDSYRNLFEAKRSLMSYQKAEMKLV